MYLKVSNLLFSISLYYTLSSFWLKLVTGGTPSFQGFILLAASALFLSAVSQRSAAETSSMDYSEEPPITPSAAPLKGNYPRKLLPVIGTIAFMLLGLLFKPGIVQIIHIIPPLLFICYLFLTDNMDVDKDEARSRFFFGLKALLLILPGALSGGGFSSAFSSAIPYLTSQLFFGVLMMRIARDPKGNQLAHGASLAAVLLGSALLYYLDAIGKITGLLSFIYDKVLVRIIYGVMIAISYLVFGIFELLRRIALGLGLETAENLPELNDIAPTEDMADSEMMEIADSPFLRIIGFILIAFVIVMIIVGIFKRLSARSLKRRSNSSSLTMTRERLEGVKKEKRLPLFRPTNPREAVRFYYRKYMRELSSGGAVIRDNSTAGDIRLLGEKEFPDGPHSQIESLYSQARYSDRTPVSSERVKQIKSAVKSL